ncbi:MAG: ferritin-like domain-containing protein [Deltaproteobacteria bacterium]|nr:ferritin-like domain-containing protein [Deltaproteobacteria bacterium]
MALFPEHRHEMERFQRIDLPADQAETLRRLQDVDVPLTLHWQWDYTLGEDHLKALYEKGKSGQWNAQTDVDWSVPLADGDWLANPESSILANVLSIVGRDEATRKQAVVDEIGFTMSQLLHGEQAALQLTAQLVNAIPDMDAKFYAASQVVDEARHCEVFASFLERKVGHIDPIDPVLKHLLDQLLSAAEWWKKAVGMQVLFEGVALGVFAGLEQNVRNPLLRDILRRVTIDEARHAAFGFHSLKRQLPHLSSVERDQLEDWTFEILECLFNSSGKGMTELLGPKYGLDPFRLLRGTLRSDGWKWSQMYLYNHTVLPNLKNLGILTERTRRGYVGLGLLPDA